MSLQMRVAKARYRGDPGLGNLLKKGLGVVGKLGIPGVSQVAQLGTTLLGTTRPVPGPVVTVGKGGVQVSGRPVGPQFPVMPGGSTLPPLTLGPPGIELPVPTGVTGADGRPAGHRLNKSNYFLRDGTFVPARSRWVRIRRRNPLNPRALDRALGRLGSASKAMKRVQSSIGRQLPRPRRAAAPKRKR